MTEETFKRADDINYRINALKIQMDAIKGITSFSADTNHPALSRMTISIDDPTLGEDFKRIIGKMTSEHETVLKNLEEEFQNL
jgi:hypothetical protein